MQLEPVDFDPFATLRDSYVARLEGFSDAELATAEDLARLAFAELIVAVTDRTGKTFDRWLLDGVAEDHPHELDAAKRWLQTFGAWLVATETNERRPDKIAGLADFYAWVTEVQRRHAVIH